jgi:hypothetical protein
MGPARASDYGANVLHLRGHQMELAAGGSGSHAAGQGVQRIIREELNTNLSRSSVYRQLYRMGDSCPVPRW